MKKVIRIFDAVIDWLSIFLISAVVIVVLLQILFRFVIQKPLSWSEELSRYLFIWIVYIGSYLCTKSNSHLGITYFVDILPTKIAKVVRTIANICLVIYMVVVIYFGFSLSFRVMGQPSAVLRVPMGIVYMAIPLGMTVMLMRMFFNFIEGKQNRPEGAL